MTPTKCNSVLIKPPPPAHQGALFRLLALFFEQVFMRTNLWKYRSCWRTKRHKVTARSDENGSQETAAWQPSPATSCLSSALQQLHSVLQQPLSWCTAQRDCDLAWQDIDPPGLPCWSQHLACTADGVIHMGLLLAGDNKKHLRSCRCWVESINYAEGGY